MKHSSASMHALRALFAVFGFVLLVACSGGGTPESTVEAFVSAAAKGDVDEMLEHISTAGIPDGEILQAKGKLQMMAGEMMTRVESHGGLDSIEIIDAELGSDGNSASVQARYKYEDGEESTDSFNVIKEDGHWKVKL